jgi:hypothetical protein
MRKAIRRRASPQVLVAAIDLLDPGAHAARDERKADHHHRDARPPST